MDDRPNPTPGGGQSTPPAGTPGGPAGPPSPHPENSPSNPKDGQIWQSKDGKTYRWNEKLGRWIPLNPPKKNPPRVSPEGPPSSGSGPRNPSRPRSR